jgi:hypothetical protein
MWVKKKILDHWTYIERKTKVFVRRDYRNNTVVINFMEGGPCTLYTYKGEWIAG